jgi:hypothetical protein
LLLRELVVVEGHWSALASQQMGNLLLVQAAA